MGDEVRNTLKKQERLSSGISLSRLFASGHYGTSDFIRYCFFTGNGLTFNRIVVSVPKRIFKQGFRLLKKCIYASEEKHKALCEKHKAFISKYKAHILKYVPYIFCVCKCL